MELLKYIFGREVTLLPEYGDPCWSVVPRGFFVREGQRAMTSTGGIARHNGRSLERLNTLKDFAENAVSFHVGTDRFGYVDNVWRGGDSFEDFCSRIESRIQTFDAAKAADDARQVTK